mgnify:CR=1 FL=1|tara:strand:- start:6024 stop:6368 length:345 start_codon:yes stop_codon:yes gene_type:complete
METKYSKEHIRKAIDNEIIVGDGHTIFAPEFYKDYFDVESITNRQYSGEGKYTLFDSVTGEPVEYIDGVYNLTFLERLAYDLNIEYRSFSGRGFQAQGIVDELKKWCEYESNDK